MSDLSEKAFKDFTKKELAALDKLKTPNLIQQFLDSTNYSADHFYRSPLQVMRDDKAHCVDGALFAACALERLGFAPMIMEITAVRDDDHLLAVYKVGGCWGAVAKSNFVGLRYRDPVYKSLRELAMSYFEPYFNTEGEKTMRGYSMPLDLTRFNEWSWRSKNDRIEEIIDKLEKSRHVKLLTPAQENLLSFADARSVKAGLLGANPEGLFDPKKDKRG